MQHSINAKLLHLEYLHCSKVNHLAHYLSNEIGKLFLVMKVVMLASDLSGGSKSWQATLQSMSRKGLTTDQHKISPCNINDQSSGGIRRFAEKLKQ